MHAILSLVCATLHCQILEHLRERRRHLEAIQMSEKVDAPPSGTSTSPTTTRKQYSPKFKARVAVEAIRGEKTLSQLGSQFKVHPIQIAKWRKSALEQLPELFVDGRTRKGRNEDADRDALYEEIGRLKVELDWLKKKVGMLD